jgi:hypothetical protein
MIHNVWAISVSITNCDLKLQAVSSKFLVRIRSLPTIGVTIVVIATNIKWMKVILPIYESRKQLLVRSKSQT